MKRINTQPCSSPDSPFIRKPSKEFFNKIAHRRRRSQVQKENLHADNLWNSEKISDSIQKPAFIPIVQKESSMGSKIKKTTIELGTFKMMHQKGLLKIQNEQLKVENEQLRSENKRLQMQNMKLQQSLSALKAYGSLSTSTLECSCETFQSNPLLQSIESSTSLSAHYREANQKRQSLTEEQRMIHSVNVEGQTLNKKFSSFYQIDFDCEQPEECKKDIDSSTNVVDVFVQKLELQIQFIEQRLKSSEQTVNRLKQQNNCLQMKLCFCKKQKSEVERQLKCVKSKYIQQTLRAKLFELSSDEEN